MRKPATIFLLTLFSLSTFAFVYDQLTERTIATDYDLKFSTRSTDGTFSGLKGTVIFSPDDLANAKIDVSVEANTIETGMKKKNEHARSSDWLDVEKYPHISFRSESFVKEGDVFLVSGTMSMHGISKKVTIPFQYNPDGVFSGTFTVNRIDYGITGVGMKASFVGEDIEITFNIPTVSKAG